MAGHSCEARLIVNVLKDYGFKVADGKGMHTDDIRDRDEARTAHER